MVTRWVDLSNVDELGYVVRPPNTNACAPANSRAVLIGVDEGYSRVPLVRTQALTEEESDPGGFFVNAPLPAGFGRDEVIAR